MAKGIVFALDLTDQCGFVAGNSAMMMATQVATSQMIPHLDYVATALRPATVVYRAPHQRRGNAEAANIVALREWAAKWGAECVPVRSKQVKRAFGLKGNAPACEVHGEAYRRGFGPCGMAQARAVAVFNLAVGRMPALAD